MQSGNDARPFLGLALALVAGITLIRIAVLVASPLELYPDEAQYWWWAQAPDIGYFSKPPLIAWLIRASTIVSGDREWAIRLPIPLLHAGTALIMFAIARSAYPKQPALAFWCAAAYITLPGVSYSSGLASTDAPLLFFWSIALFAFLRAAANIAWRWPLLCGAALGLGLLAKYAMFFFVVGAMGAAVLHAGVRQLIFSRYGLATACIAAVVVAPNIAWNASHAFTTLAHLGSNADWLHAQFSIAQLLRFIGSQFGVFGPVLSAAAIVAFWHCLRRGPDTAATAILCTMSAAPLVLIALQALVAGAKANWAAAAYIAALPLALDQILARWPRLALWTSFALHGAVLVLLWVVLILPPVADRLGIGNVFKRQQGWRELAEAVSDALSHGSYDVVASENRSVTAELLYYLRTPRPPIRIWAPDTANRNHFEMTVRLTGGARHVLLVLLPEDASLVAKTFESVRPVTLLSMPDNRRHRRVLGLYDAHFYRGPAAAG
ncbi:MAG TPA: glycosyltransferase family 39 protein [Rhizomicrobium sp.]|nr:glycosyltransferase family 39 protein [Rhizomicrobium sp.]